VLKSQKFLHLNKALITAPHFLSKEWHASSRASSATTERTTMLEACVLFCHYGKQISEMPAWSFPFSMCLTKAPPHRGFLFFLLPEQERKQNEIAIRPYVSGSYYRERIVPPGVLHAPVHNHKQLATDGASMHHMQQLSNSQSNLRLLPLVLVGLVVFWWWATCRDETRDFKIYFSLQPFIFLLVFS
jgi:hypothetical protein